MVSSEFYIKWLTVLVFPPDFNKFDRVLHFYLILVYKMFINYSPVGARHVSPLLFSSAQTSPLPNIYQGPHGLFARK
jgi:hypothetical protein